MKALRDYFSAISRTFLTLGDGMAVTCSYVFRTPATLQYPDLLAEPLTKTLPERSRGILEVDISICTGCMLCSKQCPIDCIHIETAKDPETNVRMLNKFEIDAAKCMYCGICQEACPTTAIGHSREFEGAMADVRRLMFSFVDRPVPVAKPPKKDEPIPRKQLGSIIRLMLRDPFAPCRERPAEAIKEKEKQSEPA